MPEGTSPGRRDTAQPEREGAPAARRERTRAELILRVGWRLLLLGGVAAALLLTLSPHNTQSQAQSDRAVDAVRDRIDLPFDLPDSIEARLEHNETDVLGNLLLFVPIGFIGVVVFPRHAVLIAIGGGTASLGIEVAQKVFLPSRNPSLRDVVTNAAGCLVGVVAGVIVVQLLRLRRRWREPSHA